MAVELDGTRHYSGSGEQYDRERMLFIEYFGIKVLRFENKMVFEDLEWVLAVIRSEFEWKKRTTPSAPEAGAATPPL